MNRIIQKRAAALFAAAAILLTATSCGIPAAAPIPSASASGATPTPTSAVVSAGKADHLFTVRYHAAQTLNPITGTDPDNMALAPLQYEALFVLNKDFVPATVLCDSFTTSSDGMTYTFKLKPNIVMSDGSTLTSSDVRYTLSEAKQTGRFSGRLKIIDSITTPDSLTVKITLKYADFSFTQLMDVPIIKQNSIDQNHPAGTGPYVFTSSQSPRLEALAGYRAALPVSTIYLKDDTDTQLSVDFSSQAVDFFWDDPADSSEIRILSDHETRYYNTTVLEYVGFNSRHKVLESPSLRRALGLAIDRQTIIDEVYLNHAVAAPLILSQNYRLYDAGWTPKVTDPLGEISAIFSKIGSDPEGLKDEDNNGYLEMRDSDGKWIPISLIFVVNSENPYRKHVAQLITESLKSIGIDVTLLTLDWDDYMTALQKGNFDLYLGDVSLPADNDLTALLSPGGALDYGKTGDASYVTEIKNFLGASDDTAQAVAAKALCDDIYKNAPVVPILYHQFAVHTNRNVINGMDPSQSSLFYGLTTKWKINLG